LLIASPSITANVYAHLLKERRPEAAIKTDTLLFVGRKHAERCRRLNFFELLDGA
jgi:hypothetical protein